MFSKSRRLGRNRERLMWEVGGLTEVQSSQDSTENIYAHIFNETLAQTSDAISKALADA